MKTFEEKLERLETLSEKIRDGNMPLDEAVALFEEGIKLSKQLEKELSKVERKVEILVNNPVSEEGKPELELFPELNGDDS